MSTFAQHPGQIGKTSGFRHPLRKLEDEAHALIEAERVGESGETPLIAIAMILTVLVPIAATMMLLAFGAAWLFG